MICVFIASSKLLDRDPSSGTLTRQAEKELEVTIDYFPLYVNSYYNENTTTFDMSATVNYTYNRLKIWAESQLNSEFDSSLQTTGNRNHEADGIDVLLAPSDLSLAWDEEVSNVNANRIFAVHWQDEIKSTAAYNRSLDHSTVYVESGAALETFQIASISKDSNCYSR